jgi:hypothetical protein
VVELNVADLAVHAEGDEDPKYPYHSFGAKEYVSKIRLGVNSYKGELHYTAEFVPAVHLKGVSFGHPKNQVQQALDRDDGGEINDRASAWNEDYQKIPAGVTVTLPKEEKGEGDVSIKVPPAPETHGTANGGGRAGSPPAPKTEEDDGVEISKEELLRSRKYPLVHLTCLLARANNSEQHPASSFSISFLADSRRRHAWKS